ncbi:sulfatase [Halomarina salina]|uniref:Sulfatase n=1 Tax=Halomarina salina TaxID=1872699 RepID=A0ABD5RSA8_9EURY|nr:sulfatase [Halomarina salina]
MRPIVFISVDCLRADHLGCYGYNRPTSPNIDQLASNSTLFEYSYSNCPGTRWAFQSLHTGVSTIKIDGLGIPEGYNPLAVYLSELGYTTGGFAVNGFVSRDYRYDTGFHSFYSVKDSSSQHGLVMRAGRKVNDVFGSKTVRNLILEPIHDRLRNFRSGDSNQFQPVHSDANTVDQALSFIDEVENPYFLWVHLMDAHTPYGFWPEHLQKIRGDTDIEHTIHPGQEGKVKQGREPSKEVIDTYDAGIRSADKQIGRLLKAVPDNATVVLTGDHGEEFGQFGDFHNASLYSTLTQVPIIVRDPELAPGRSEMPAQHLDIPPTLLHAAGLDIPSHWEGEPLQTVDRKSGEPIFFTLGPDEIGVRVGGWKYIESDGRKELYQVPHAAAESEQSNNEEKRQELQTLVGQYRASAGAAGTGQSELDDGGLSKEVEDNLEDLGYI